MGTLHLLGKLSGKSMCQSQVKGKFILFTNLWIHNGCGRPQFQYLYFQSEFTTVWITNCSLAWSNRVLFKEIMDNACEYIYVLLFKKKKKEKLFSWKKNCLLINVSLKMIKIIFKLTSYQLLFVYCCCFFSTWKLGNPQEQIFCQFCQTHAKTKRKIDRKNLWICDQF